MAVVCSSSCPESEVLMKAKELAHNVKLLFGSQQVGGVRGASRELLCRSKQVGVGVGEDTAYS